MADGHIVGLLVAARRVLDVGSQGALGVLLGASERTGQRWESTSGATPSKDQLAQLARLVHARDEDLAARLAAAAGSSPGELGLVSRAAAAEPRPTTTARAVPDPALLVDTVVCAAAEAMDVPPGAIRAALRAAFRRARLAGLSVEDVERALEGGGGSPP